MELLLAEISFLYAKTEKMSAENVNLLQKSILQSIFYGTNYHFILFYMQITVFFIR